MYTSIAFVLEQTHRTFWMWNKTKVFFSPSIPRSILMTELFPCMYFWRCIFIVGPSPIRDSTLDFRWRRFLCETLFESKLVPCTHTYDSLTQCICEWSCNAFQLLSLSSCVLIEHCSRIELNRKTHDKLKFSVYQFLAWAGVCAEYVV